MCHSRDGSGGQKNAFRQRDAEAGICHSGFHALKCQGHAGRGVMGRALTAFPTTEQGIWTSFSRHGGVIKGSQNAG